MKKITIVFPMAGEGQRFGSKFKPFLKIFDRKFIELAMEPFLKHKDKIERFVFIVRKDHSKEFNVRNVLTSFSKPMWFVYEIKPTSSPIETISSWLKGARLQHLQNVIFCDCDHSLNVDEIFESIEKSNYDAILPVYPINDVEINKWSIVSGDDNGIALDIAEKKYPEAGNRFYGVIGCYYFKRFSKPSNEFKYISDIISHLIQNNGTVRLIHIKEAEFFGDPERLNKLYEEKKASTIFCDLDGTVIKHEAKPDWNTGITILEGAKEKIDQWRKEHCFIVFTTSRDEQFRKEMEEMLRVAGIKYEYMVMGLPPGTRYLINDRKPNNYARVASSIEVTRDIGIKDVKLGHSLADHYRLGQKSIKEIPEDASDYQKKKFKSQYDTMKYLDNNSLFTHLVPDIYEFTGTKYEMQFMDGYKPLHELPDKTKALEIVLKELEKLYAIKEPVKKEWLDNYLITKIYSKEREIEELGLDAKPVYEILLNLTEEQKEELSPDYLTFIHGDLTYENILVKGNYIKLIDFDNDNQRGAIEMDLGKLWQSADAGYEYWDKGGFEVNGVELQEITGFYSRILDQNVTAVRNKAFFYCACHFIRMIPYQCKTSITRGHKALLLSKQYLNKVFE